MKKFKTRKTWKVNNALKATFTTLDYILDNIVKNAYNGVWEDKEAYKEFLIKQVKDEGRTTKFTIHGIQLLEFSYKEYDRVYKTRVDKRVEKTLEIIKKMEF